MKDYDEATRSIFKFLIEHDLVGAFCDAMRSRAEIAARDMISANDNNLMHALRGQISICYELHDGAKSALEAKKASANAGNADGLPNLPDMEL